MKARLIGIGTALPENGGSQEMAWALQSRFVATTEKQARQLKALYRRSGVERRHSVVFEADGTMPFYPEPTSPEDRGPGLEARMARYAEAGPPLGLRAARAALDDAGLEPGQIDELVVVSCTGFVAPGSDRYLIEQLGLPPTTGRVSVGFMGCHGAINGLHVAYGHAARGRTSLVVAIELCTLHFQYGWDREHLVPSGLFADGSAAAVVSPGTDQGWAIRGHLSHMLPDSADDMTWKLGEHGFKMTLSPRVPSLIAEHLPAAVDAFLGANGLERDDVATWAVHPGGPRIVAASLEALGVDAAHGEISREILAGHGNMSSPTILFILEALRRRGAPTPLLALAFGPGLAVEGLLLE